MSAELLLHLDVPYFQSGTVVCVHVEPRFAVHSVLLIAKVNKKLKVHLVVSEVKIILHFLLECSVIY